ncbi:sigma-54-dependent Fis family transcriptional regulator [Nocardia callitridis]|uniref:sigma-54-dependent Fis family transcriptional regulator n=1 Tax=Nocardia callitridis TaxID=648753 RepID=UPI0031EF43A5
MLEDGTMAQGREPDRPEIALSWKRSRLNGVDPSTPIVVDSDTDVGGHLLRAAGPVLDGITKEIVDTGVCVFLADRDCRVLASVFSDRTMRRALERLDIVVGSRFGEEDAGTNALGTPIELGRSVIVHGDEHYLEVLKGLSCYGHPIVHPVTRRVEGVLDITGPAGSANPLFAPFLARAVADIEQRLLEGSRASEQRLVDAFHRVSHQRHLAVAAIGADILLSNRAALDLLDTADHASLRSLVGDLGPNQRRRITVELASGAMARVDASRVAGADGGAVFLVEPLHQSKSRIPRSRSATQPPENRLRAQLILARESDDALLLTGEAGSGRTSAAADVVHSCATQWFDATRMPFDGHTHWLDELARAVRQRAEVIVIEHAQLLSDRTLPVVANLIEHSATGPRLILTSSPMHDLPPAVAAVLSRCPARISIPSLRERIAELPELARAILEDHAPGVQLTVSALEALEAAQWPGNLVELRMVLVGAADRRDSNRIDIGALPPDYRTTGKVSRLTGMAKAERQAIITALADCAGNKVHAAHQLGISRSTLYTRMRALDITR